MLFSAQGKIYKKVKKKKKKIIIERVIIYLICSSRFPVNSCTDMSFTVVAMEKCFLGSRDFLAASGYWGKLEARLSRFPGGWDKYGKKIFVFPDFYPILFSKILNLEFLKIN